MHEKVLPRGSRELLDRLAASASPSLTGWILAGGTGLALHLGHRVSEGFDFFRTDEVDMRDLQTTLAQAGPCETLQQIDDALTVLLDEVKLSFFRVGDPFLYAPSPFRFFQLADRRDIALLKLAAVSSRGSRKDFVDLYFILRSGSRLRDLFLDLPRKYGEGRVNPYHVLKSLTCFEDAENEPLPVMLEPFGWEACKSFFIREAHAIVL